MAGAGRRTFQPGEVLTASNVNSYLMDQSVMRFASSAARGSAVGTAVIAEGMVSYLDDTNQIDVYDSTQWVQVHPYRTGSLVQTVSTTKTDTFSASIAAGAFSAITGLSASITPKSTANKVIVSVHVNGSYGTDISYAGYRILANGTAIGIGDASGVRGRLNTMSVGLQSANVTAAASFQHVHSPNTTSAVSYTVEFFGQSASTVTYYVNRSITDDNVVQRARTASSITLMEVAG